MPLIFIFFQLPFLQRRLKTNSCLPHGNLIVVSLNPLLCQRLLLHLLEQALFQLLESFDLISVVVVLLSLALYSLGIFSLLYLTVLQSQPFIFNLSLTQIADKRFRWWDLGAVVVLGF